MQLAAFLELRPFAYHTTAAGNLEHIRRVGALQCARHLLELESGGADSRVSQHRKVALTLRLGSGTVVIRDQRPLAAGAIDFESGWDLPRFVSYLNGLVFFWPGDMKGPIKPGHDHFERYAGEREALVVLRAPLADLLACNQGRTPRFSPFNSGSARCNKGQKAPRGESTFCTATAFIRPRSEVKEIVFEGQVALPLTTEIAESVTGPWRPL